MLDLSGHDRNVAANESLFYSGDPVKSVFLVQQGCVVLRRQTVMGAELILHVAEMGAVIAEASVYSSTYHCDAIAREASRLHVFSKANFRAQLADNPALADCWAMKLASSVQAARFRAEIRSLRTVAERLDAWVGAGREIPAKGLRQELAAELGVSREALYRELSRSGFS
ncbi:MAG: Crp/Fnr family transcriptional regulator [Granulosicoccus sp.]